MNMPSALGQHTVLHVFPTFDVGGAQVRFAQIANACKRRFRHIIVAMDGRYRARERLDPALDVSFRTVMGSPASLLGRIGAYRRELAALKPDVVVTYNWGAIEWALANLPAIVPHIHVEDGFGVEEAKAQLRRRIWVRRIALMNARRVVVPSRALAAIARRSWKVPRERLQHIPNGIEALSPLRPGERDLRALLGLADDCPLVGWVGALRAEKNLGRLVRAFAQVETDAHLVIVGDGPESNRILAQVEAFGLRERAHFLGARPDVCALLWQLDLLVLSSDTEQMPLVVLEAMASRLPLASVDVGDIREIVAPENRPFIVPPTDEALGHAIQTLIADRALRQSIGTANFHHVRRHFTAESMIKSYADLFERVALGRVQTGPAEVDEEGRFAVR